MDTVQAKTKRNYDYSNAGWPRDFDIRIEVAEQQEVLEGERLLIRTKPKARRPHTNPDSCSHR